jgi:RHS repeat-associated protein
MVSGDPEVLDALQPLGPDGQAFAGRFNGLKHAAGGKKAASIGEGGSAVSSLQSEERSPEVQKPGEEEFHLFPELGGQNAKAASGFALAAFRPGSGSGAPPAAYPLPPAGSRHPSGLRAQSTPVGLTSGYTWYYTLRDEANRPSIQYHVDANGNVVPDRFFVYMGNLLVASFEYGPGTWLYYTEDHLGSIRMVTNGAGQDICEKRYYPYGYEIVDFCQAPAAGGSPLKFAGMERDASSGIDYDHARYMASLGGRFLSTDNVSGGPLDPQTWNRYSYARSNPIRLTDPTGLYVLGCNIVELSCAAAVDANLPAFEQERQTLLTSQNPETRAAAAAYGDLGDANGVTVNFADPGRQRIGKALSYVGSTPDASALFPRDDVTIKPGLKGLDLKNAIGHEGRQVFDARRYDATLVMTSSGVTGDASLHLTRYATEVNAYHVTQAILVEYGNGRPYDFGCAGCALGSGANVDQAIVKILANSPYNLTKGSLTSEGGYQVNFP